MLESLIRPFLRSREIGSTFRQEGREYSVAIEVPDLTHNALSYWGDWGPMVSLALTPSQAIGLAYDDGDRKRQFVLRPQRVSLLSPMLAAERQEFPFYLEFDDEAREQRFRLYLHPDGEFSHLTATRLDPRTHLGRLLREPVPHRSSTSSRAGERDPGEARKSA